MNQLFNDFNRVTAWVIGDVMIDSYFYGSTTRISPEAPVPVVDLTHKEHRLGGAGNVALNLQSLGANPVLFGLRGNDEQGELLTALMREAGLNLEGIVTDYNRITTNKTRIIANQHQVLRVDEEVTNDIEDEQQKQFLDLFNHAPKPDVVVLQDYNKGMLSASFIQSIISYCNSRGIPTVVDPKKRNFLAFQECTLFKPNRKELLEGLNINEIDHPMEAIENAAASLRNQLNAKKVMVTLSEKGILLNSAEEKLHFGAHRRRIVDVSGAGDSVVSVAALCLALDTSNEVLAELSNLAGGLVCEKLGVSPIDKNNLLAEAINLFNDYKRAT